MGEQMDVYTTLGVGVWVLRASAPDRAGREAMSGGLSPPDLLGPPRGRYRRQPPTTGRDLNDAELEALYADGGNAG